MNLFFCISLFLFLINYVHSASILALFSTLSYSDNLVYRGLVEHLARSGHHVVMMTAFPGFIRYPEIEKIVELDVSQACTPFWGEYKKLLSNVDDYFPITRKINELSIKVAIAQLRSPQVTALFVNPNIKFDLVITEADMPILYPVAEKYNAPHIAITASTGKINMYEAKGNPNHPLLYPDVNTLNYGKLSILQKAIEFQRYLIYKYEYYYYFMPLCQMAVEKIFSSKRDLVKVEEDIDMLFVTGNSMLIGNRPTVPAITYVDGLHLKPGLALPEDLDKIMNANEKGCIYFSLGTVQEAEELSIKTVQMFMNAFSELPYTVLFKIGNVTNLKVPGNVHANVWFPQEQVLAHPKLKAFVTHGGQRSLEEAVFYAVPIVGLPIVASRRVFISQITKHGPGEIIDPYYMDKDTVKKIVLEVASNDKYKKAMTYLKDVVLDDVITGPERAVWYVEYVLTHGGAKHLRSPLVGMNFYEYFLLDVFFIVFIIAITLLLATYFIVRIIIKRVRTRFSKAEPKGKFKSL